MSYGSIGLIALNIIYRVLDVFSILLFAYCILSWFVSPYSKIYRFLSRVMNPFLNPIRRLMDKIFRTQGMVRLDFSPIVLSLLIQLFRYLLQYIVMLIF